MNHIKQLPKYSVKYPPPSTPPPSPSPAPQLHKNWEENTILCVDVVSSVLACVQGIIKPSLLVPNGHSCYNNTNIVLYVMSGVCFLFAQWIPVSDGKQGHTAVLPSSDGRSHHSLWPRRPCRGFSKEISNRCKCVLVCSLMLLTYSHACVMYMHAWVKIVLCYRWS